MADLADIATATTAGYKEVGPLRAWMEPFMELSRREPRLRRLDVLVRLAVVAYPA